MGEKRLPTQVEGGWEHVLDRVLAALEELLRHTPREQVLCVGMGVPGPPGGGEPCPGHLPGGCEIVTAQLGDAAGMLGAAVYGARRMGRAPGCEPQKSFPF